MTQVFILRYDRTFVSKLIRKIRGEETTSSITLDEISFSFVKKGQEINIPYVNVTRLRRYHSSDDGESLIIYVDNKKIKEFFAYQFENGQKFALFKKTLIDACTIAEKD